MTHACLAVPVQAWADWACHLQRRRALRLPGPLIGNAVHYRRGLGLRDVNREYVYVHVYMYRYIHTHTFACVYTNVDDDRLCSSAGMRESGAQPQHGDKDPPA